MKKTQSPKLVTVCFDLDQTLIARLREDIISYLVARGFSYDQIFPVYLKVADHRFTPQKFADALGLSSRETKALVEYTYSLFTDMKYVYPGAKELLTKLQNEAILFLVTFGDRKYQLAKIKNFCFEKYFSNIIVTPHADKREISLKLAKQTKEKFIMIDDSRTVERTMKELNFPFIKVKKSWKDPAYFKRLYIRIKKEIVALS